MGGCVSVDGCAAAGVRFGREGGERSGLIVCFSWLCCCNLRPLELLRRWERLLAVLRRRNGQIGGCRCGGRLLWGRKCWRRLFTVAERATVGLLPTAVGKKKIKREGLCVVGWKRKRRWGNGVEAEWRR
jgi:hypothetical protein